MLKPGITVIRSLHVAYSDDATGALSGLAILCSLVTPGDGDSTPETQSNAVTLLDQLAKGRGSEGDELRATVRKAIDVARCAGRRLSPGALNLVEGWEAA